MANILKKYIKDGVIITGDDNLELDTPTFEIININIDTINKILKVEILHEVQQESITQKHSRTLNIDFNNLPAAVKTTGKSFLEAIETDILKLPQYKNSIAQ